MTSIFTDLETSRKIHILIPEKKTEFSYYGFTDFGGTVHSSVQREKQGLHDYICPAYSLQELFEMLPQSTIKESILTTPQRINTAQDAGELLLLIHNNYPKSFIKQKYANNRLR